MVNTSSAPSIRHFRKQAGLSQAALAAAAGVNRLTVLRHETGSRSPTVAVLQRYAAAMGIDPQELMAAPAPVEGVEP